MKDFLLVLFYQAIVAVNTAIIVNGIIWLARRKDKQEKKPNPDFSPPPTRAKSDFLMEAVTGDGVAKRWAKKGSSFPRDITICGKPYHIWTIEHSDPEMDAAEYREIKLPTTGSCAIKPKDGVSADEAAKLFSKLSQAAAGLRGIDELQEKIKALADTLDRTDKKPVTPERVKEAGFETERIECRNCKHFLTTDEEATVGECGLNDEIMFKDETRACFEPKEKKTELSCRDCKWFVKWRDGDTICANTGLHIDANLKGAHCGYFERKPRTSTVRPKPLGTTTRKG